MLVADDHPVYREGVARAIKARPEFELVGEAEDGRDALQQIKGLTPDVAVLDVQMPGLTGNEVLNAVKRDGDPTRIVLLSAHIDSETVYRAVAAGAGACPRSPRASASATRSPRSPAARSSCPPRSRPAWRPRSRSASARSARR